MVPFPQCLHRLLAHFADLSERLRATQDGEHLFYASRHSSQSCHSGSAALFRLV